MRKRIIIIAALALAAVAIVVGPKVVAQATGYRFTQNGITFAGNGTVCFEPTYNAGPDVCFQRTGIGHLSILTGSLGVNADMAGTATLASGTKTVTFANAFAVAPLCEATWNGSGTFTTGASLKCVTTTTTAVITSSTGTDTAVVNYEIIPNPN